MAPRFEKDTEITGRLAARMFLSSSIADADLFLVFRVFAADAFMFNLDMFNLEAVLPCCLKDVCP